MSRTFIYARVSTADQTTENQVREIAGAGFTVDPKRIITEQILVTKLDRLGRNAMDVRATIERLDEMGVRVHCLALGGVDLTSAAGKMTMTVLSAVAEFERDLLIERTQSGLARAKAEGKTLGRKPALSTEQQQEARQKLAAGVSVSELARIYKTTRQTIMRVRAATETNSQS
jgi:putative DNA-invertase from lambdoid prophage Rac